MAIDLTKPLPTVLKDVHQPIMQAVGTLKNSYQIGTAKLLTRSNGLTPEIAIANLGPNAGEFLNALGIIRNAYNALVSGNAPQLADALAVFTVASDGTATYTAPTK